MGTPHVRLPHAPLRAGGGGGCGSAHALYSEFPSPCFKFPPPPRHALAAAAAAFFYGACRQPGELHLLQRALSWEPEHVAVPHRLLAGTAGCNSPCSSELCPLPALCCGAAARSPARFSEAASGGAVQGHPGAGTSDTLWLAGAFLVPPSYYGVVLL